MFEIICLITATLIATVCSQNTVLSGANFKHVLARSDNLWAITNYLQVVQYTNDGWQFKNRGFGTAVAAQSDGSVLLLIDFVPTNWGSNVRKWNGDWNYWDYVPAWAFAAQGDSAIHVAVHGHLSKKDELGNFYRVSNTTANNLQGAAGVDDDTWRLDIDGHLQHLGCGALTQQLALNGTVGVPVYVDVNDAARVVITDHTRTAYLYDGQNIRYLSDDCKLATVGSNFAYCLNGIGQIVKIDLTSFNLPPAPIPPAAPQEPVKGFPRG